MVSFMLLVKHACTGSHKLEFAVFKYDMVEGMTFQIQFSCANIAYASNIVDPDTLRAATSLRHHGTSAISMLHLMLLAVFLK